MQLKEKETYVYDQIIMDTPEKVYQLMRDVFGLEQAADEYVYLIALNTKSRVLGVFEVTHGIGNASLLDARGIFMRALHIGADSIILAHNHPSGVALPSKEDKCVCERMEKAGVLLNIPVTDFIIVADGFYSFKENGMLQGGVFQTV